MAFREVSVVEVREVLRAWLSGVGLRTVGERAGVDRKTARRYVRAAEDAGVVRDGGLGQVTDEVVGRVVSVVRPARPVGHGSAWGLLLAGREQITTWVGKDLTVVKIGILLERQGVVVPYRTLHRFCVECCGFGRGATTVRVVDGEPGVECQIDFGRMGLVYDPVTGRRRVTHALIFTAVYSRHMFVWLTFSQTLEAVIAGCEAAWAFFDGVFKVLVPEYVPRNIFPHDPRRYPTEERERLHMRRRPRGLVHAQHRPHEHVPRTRQDHRERPHRAPQPGARVGPHPQLAVVDLSLRPRIDLIAQHHDPVSAHLLGQVRRHIPLQRRHAGQQTPLVA